MALPVLPGERRFDNPQLPDPQIYSHAVSVDSPGRLVFISGQLGQRKDGSYPEELQDEVAQSFQNLVDVLRADGADVSDLVKLTLYCVGWSHDGAMAFFGPLLQALLSANGVQGRPTTTLVPVSQLADPRARFEVDGIAAISDKVRTWSSSRKGVSQDAAPTVADVIVVGGGFSGLQAAVDMHNAGLKCIVLEANPRVGGRSYTSPLSGNEGHIELGATWINQTTQPRIYALAQEFGLDCVSQHDQGANIWQGSDGRVHRLERGAPPAPPADSEGQAQFGALLQRLEIMQQKVDLESTTSTAGSDVTVEEWVQDTTFHPWIRDLMRHAVRGLVGRESRDVGMHYMVDYIKSGGGLTNLISEGEFGAQSLKIKQGTSAIAHGLANKLPPGCVLVDSPVTRIKQSSGSCLVSTSNGRQFRAARVVMANPTNTYSQIHFVPTLPFAKRAILSRTLPGRYAKILVTYKKPWWRTLGLSGQFSSFSGPINFSWEISDEVNGNYTLALFTAADIADKWYALDALKREQAIIAHLVELVGKEHADLVTDVAEMNEKDWTSVGFIGGAPTCAMRPGDLQKYGQALREPFDNIHFAGGELAFEWKGYLEGALLSGSRAAAEVVSALRSTES